MSSQNAMHTRATSAAAAAPVEEETIVESECHNVFQYVNRHVEAGEKTAKQRALGDITNISNSNTVGFPSKKPSTTQHDAATAATKIRRTVATKAESRTSAHARRAKAVQLAAAVSKEMPSIEQNSSTTNNSPMSLANNIFTEKRKRAAWYTTKRITVGEDDDFVFCGEPLPAGVHNIDVADLGHHLTESRFALEIHRNFLRREMNFMARFDYMDEQEDITTKMRAILIDWLVDVHLKFKLQPETLFLTVNIIDRFLERQPVLRRKLQLVGVTAMLIACKYEEIYAPITKDFVYISDKAYSEEEILKMEAIMLNKLDFTITVPSSLTFLDRTLKAFDYCERYRHQPRLNMQVINLARYCIELGMQDSSMLRFRPSQQAAAAVLLAAKLVYGDESWCETMKYHSGNWDTIALSQCEQFMRKLLIHEQDALGTNKLTAIKRKFSGSRYGEISTHAAKIDFESDISSSSMDICNDRD